MNRNELKFSPLLIDTLAYIFRLREKKHGDETKTVWLLKHHLLMEAAASFSSSLGCGYDSETRPPKQAAVTTAPLDCRSRPPKQAASQQLPSTVVLGPDFKVHHTAWGPRESSHSVSPNSKTKNNKPWYPAPSVVLCSVIIRPN